ncbi:ABC transporter substrate-binding protein [Paraburkholderia tagetis]|uniref:Extracellular solute-binding protein n=1 Tax=Paraburkholderia tagetis TaxID=2913261 RepID=A0A9X1UKM0_9BURK|nr:extracellular solute-binding protein [Paraburkholderia tagetis]MCG5074831.1 extracellular solute-binding protein [Paraburkholderia tagetis]
MKRNFRLAAMAGLLGAALTLFGASPAFSAGYVSSESVAQYNGADRTQKLVDGAKQENKLTVYSSLPPADFDPIVKAFEQKYGVHVTVWRSSASGILQRAISEGRAGRYEADVFETNGPQLEAMYREKLLQPINSPVLKLLIPAAIQDSNAWTATRLNVFTVAYNTNLIKKADLPTSYKDLLDPRWKGKLGVEGQDSLPWFAETVHNLGGQPGIALFKQIVAKNGVSVRRGHTLVANLVASGDVPMAFGVYNYKVQSMKEAGAPIDWFSIGPAITQPNGVGVAHMLRHPNAAVLFYDFLLTDGQAMYAAHDMAVTNTTVKRKLPDVSMQIISNKDIIDNQAKNQALFNSVFSGT